MWHGTHESDKGFLLHHHLNMRTHFWLCRNMSEKQSKLACAKCHFCLEQFTRGVAHKSASRVSFPSPPKGGKRKGASQHQRCPQKRQKLGDKAGWCKECVRTQMWMEENKGKPQLQLRKEGKLKQARFGFADCGPIGGPGVHIFDACWPE